MTRQTLASSAAGLAAVVAVAGGYAYLQKDMISRAVAAPVATAAATTASAPGTAAVAVAAPMDFSGIVDRYGPAVVNISTTAHAQRTSMQGLPPGMSPDDPFSEFFKRAEPLCGRLQQDKLDALFAARAGEVQSAVLLPIGSTGMLAIGSTDANRFHPGMGTVFLKLIGEAISTAIARYAA